MITISTSLLEAVARWALPERNERMHMSQVVFRDNEIIAVDGNRLVRVKIETHDLTIGVRRCDALAAVAAQDALLGRHHGPERPSTRTIRITPVADGRVWVHIDDAATIVVKQTDVSMLPPIDEVMTVGRREVPPDGIAFNPSFLAAIEEVIAALEESTRDRFVRLVQWGGMFDPTVYEGPQGSRFVIMPMRQAND